MREKVQIYLAGKVGGVKNDIVEGFTDANFVCSDGYKHSEHGWGFGRTGIDTLGNESDFMIPRVLKPIQESAGLLAIFDTADSFGSIVEITIAARLGKPVQMILLKEKCECGEKYVGCACCSADGDFYDAYWFVACLPNVSSVRVTNKKEARSAAGKFVARFTYHEYLKSPEWIKRRTAKIQSSGGKCQLCGIANDLNVHHNTYLRVGQELDSDLVVLCRSCHKKHHE